MRLTAAFLDTGCWALYSMLKDRRKRRNSGFIDNDMDDVENRLNSSSHESTSHRQPLDQHHHRASLLCRRTAFFSFISCSIAGHQRRIRPHVQTGRTSGSTTTGAKSHNNSPHLSRSKFSLEDAALPLHIFRDINSKAQSTSR